jgi:alpha-D-ribose 1-methylphosphonate 5-triphosphate synthase subunit PhnG
VKLPEEGEQHASNENAGTAESSVFGDMTVETSAVEQVSCKASSDDSGFGSISGRSTTDAGFRATSTRLLPAPIDERAQPK